MMNATGIESRINDILVRHDPLGHADLGYACTDSLGWLGSRYDVETARIIRGLETAGTREQVLAVVLHGFGFGKVQPRDMASGGNIVNAKPAGSVYTIIAEEIYALLQK